MILRALRLIAASALTISFCLPAIAGEVEHDTLSITELRSKATVGRNSAAYATIVNHGDTVDRLVAIETDVAKAAELHTHLMEDGVMKMQRIDAIEVHPGAPGILKPGGDHIMLIGMKRKFEAGETMPMTFVFEQAGKIDVLVQVEAWRGSGQGSQKTHQGHGSTATN